MANLPDDASLQITNNLPISPNPLDNEDIEYTNERVPQNPISISPGSEHKETIKFNWAGYLDYKKPPQNDKTWLIRFKDQPYCLEMVDVLKGSEPYHTLFRFSPITPITNNECEITAKMGGITSVAQKVDDVKIEIFNKLPELCNVFTTINKNFKQTNIIPPKIPDSNPNSLSFHFYMNYIIEIYFTLNSTSRFAVSITINQSRFLVRKYGMDQTKFKLNYVEIQPQDINLTIEPDEFKE